EESVVLECGSPILLSDIDLVVIVESLEAFKEFYPARSEIGSVCEKLLPGVRFLGRVEIGMVQYDYLHRLSPRPGVYDMKERGKLLYGDREILDHITSYEPFSIGGRGAVVLIENRMISFLGAYPWKACDTDEEIYRFLYEMARVYTDILTSALCLAGLYRPGYVERCKFVGEIVDNESLADLLPTELLPKIKKWTDFKIAPSTKNLGVELDERSILELWEKGASDLLGFWEKGEAFLQGPDYDTSKTSVDHLLVSRKGSGKLLEHLRNWKTFLSRLPVGRRVALAKALRKRLLSEDPMDVVREYGVRLIDHRLRYGTDREVSMPPGSFPHCGGDWRDAVSRLYSLWVEIVFGRKENCTVGS
ncbi:MAG: hypothetical protein KAX38_05610, partial [Candidatus Krumholzibacteria bacterium]|nr:hypothetical protein [Candidatus Krumholzibacteria bacterium]